MRREQRMKSSLKDAHGKRVGAIEPLPATLSSMWRLCKLGYRHEQRLMIMALILSQVAALPAALLALWLALLGGGLIQHRPALVLGAAVGMALSTAATWFLVTISTRVQRTFRDKVTIALEAHVAHLQASIVSVAHQERPEYLDRLSMLRNQVFVLDHMYVSLFSTLGWLLRPAVTMALLAWVHPALLLLGVLALPAAIASFWRPDVERKAQERGAQSERLSRHLFNMATTAAAGKEVRVIGMEIRLCATGEPRGSAGMGPSRGRAGARPFGMRLPGRFSGVRTRARWYLSRGEFTPRQHKSYWYFSAGAGLAAYVRAAVGEIGFLRGFWADGSRRLAWLEDYAAREAAAGDRAAPTVLREGDSIRSCFVRLSGRVAAGAGGRLADVTARYRGGDCRREWSR